MQVTSVSMSETPGVGGIRDMDTGQSELQPSVSELHPSELHLSVPGPAELHTSMPGPRELDTSELDNSVLGPSELDTTVPGSSEPVSKK